jgi:hypothetical protein
MAIGSGLASQIGIKKETTYGTRVAPTAFYEYESEGVKFTRNRIASRGLRAGRTFQSSTRRLTTTKGGAGPVSLEVPNKGFGAWLDLLHGNTVTPVQQATTTAYLQTHNIGTSDPTKSATVQIGKPDTGGTVRPFDYTGAMVTDYQFSCDTGGFLMANFGLDVQNEDTTQTLATASYPTSLSTFHFAQCAVVVNSVTATSLSSFNLSGALARKTDRFFLGATGLKAKPIQNDYSVATLAFGGEFSDLTYYGLYTADTIVPVTVTFTGAVIASTYFETIKYTMAACQLDGETPNVGGPDVLQQPLNLTVLDDGTNAPVKIEYTAVDTTI